MSLELYTFGTLDWPLPHVAIFAYLAAWQRVRQVVTCRRKLAPPRVEAEVYWSEPPPVVSPRCRWWLKRIANGWRPSKRVARLGYHCSAEYFGVYIWEYLRLIAYALWWPHTAEWYVDGDGVPRRFVEAPLSPIGQLVAEYIGGRRGLV